jgi:hypothetical protein
LVGVGREAEFDHAARVVERNAGAFERAEIRDRDRERIGELLDLGAAGVVDDAAVGCGKRTFESGLGQRGDMLAEARHQIAVGDWKRSGQAVRADGVVAEADGDRAGGVPAALRQRRNVVGGVLGRFGCLQLDGDGVEVHAFERAGDRLGVARQAIAIGADGACEDEGQPRRTVLQFVQRLGVGHGRIGMVDPRLHLPGARARRDRMGAGRPPIQRLDRDAVIGLGDQAFVGPVLEGRAHELEPVLAACGGKLGGKRKVVRH